MSNITAIQLHETFFTEKEKIFHNKPIKKIFYDLEPEESDRDEGYTNRYLADEDYIRHLRDAAEQIRFKLAKDEKSGITILLASSSEDIYLEDFICGGLLSKKLLSMGVNLGDSAYASMLAWNNAKENLNEIIKKSYHGEYLKGIGFENDIDFCLKIDFYPIVPWSNNGKIGLLPKERFIS